MTLAKQARPLNLALDVCTGLRRAKRRGGVLPSLILMTDAARLPDPLPAIARLAPGSAVILRHRKSPERASLARRIARHCRARRLLLLVADDARLAHMARANGIHLGRRALAFPVHRGGWGRRRQRWLMTAAAHSWRDLILAARRGADAALLSPVFATRSHPAARPLGLLRFALWARRAPIPVYALGGIDETTARGLRHTGAVGIAAIGAFADSL